MNPSWTHSKAWCKLLPVRFVDAFGSEGWIGDDFGPEEIAESVEAYIDEIEGDGLTAEERIRSLLVDLPERCAIQRIGRANGETRG